MRNVKNPILIDQNYCPDSQGCPNQVINRSLYHYTAVRGTTISGYRLKIITHSPWQSSGVKISGVTYKNIRGTSATKEAVTFDCSKSNPCTGIRLQDINLMYMNKATTSSCSNIRGTSTGVLVPQSCL